MPWAHPATWRYRQPDGTVYQGHIRPPTRWREMGYTEVRMVAPASDEVALRRAPRQSEAPVLKSWGER